MTEPIPGTFDDTLRGTDGDDSLDVHGGNTLLIGGLGNDTLDVHGGWERADGTRPGIAFLDGGPGDDSLNVFGGTATLEGGPGQDTLYFSEGTATLEGRAGDDSISIRNGTAILNGGEGNDTLEARGGFILLHDASRGDWVGNATLNGGLGDDSLNSWGGTTNLNGGAGNDTLDVHGGSDVLPDGTQLGAVTVEGGAGDDFLENSGANGRLSGGDGNDTIESRNGDVTLDGGAGDDLLYAYRSERIVNYNPDTNQDILDGRQRVLPLGDVLVIGGPGVDTFQVVDHAQRGLEEGGFEVVSVPGGLRITSDFGNVFTLMDDVEFLSIGTERWSRDVFSYDRLASMVLTSTTGTDGDDTLTGSDARDDISGLLGDDWIAPGWSEDTVDGGGGQDTVSYADLRAHIHVIDLDGRVEVRLSGSSRILDTLFSIEHLIGTAHRDRFSLDQGTFEGLAGGDLFLAAGPGLAHYDGGAGVDSVNYRGAQTGGISASLFRGTGWEGDAAGDTYENIEVLAGTRFDDQLWGDNHENTLFGGDGNDTLTGAGGNDSLNGYNGSGDTAVFSGAVADYTIAFTNIRSYWNLDIEVSHLNGGVDGVDTLTNVEKLRFADTILTIGRGLSPDGLIATEGFAYLRGGDDTLFASSVTAPDGRGVFDGGSGKDILSYENSAEGIYASLLRGRGWDGDAAGDRFDRFEWLRGSGHDDRLDGSNGRDTLEGLGGDDTITGAGGNDYILAGFGTDTIVFSGRQEEYRISTAGFRTEVEHLGDGADGIDIIAHAEVLRFADGDVVL